MGDRRHARELALQALFYLDLNPDEPFQGLEAFCELRAEEIPESVRPFFTKLVQGVITGREDIDALINRWARNWKISRMPVVDRNIMRVAVFEMTRQPDIPPSVSINEAVEIAKKFGTRESGPFVNGVLDRIRTAIAAAE